MEFTQIIPEHPGYYWRFTADRKWLLCWEPVHGYYSPPKLDEHISHAEVEIPQDLVNSVGVVIGKDGVRFKWITEKTKTHYIFFNEKTGKVEIWGDRTYKIDSAKAFLQKHFDHTREKLNSF